MEAGRDQSAHFGRANDNEHEQIGKHQKGDQPEESSNYEWTGVGHPGNNDRTNDVE
jgi:hypothetical protein